MSEKRQNARGQATRRAVLRCTKDLVEQYGYSGTTIARITSITGKPASSIYWHFGSKDELITAALDGSYSREVASNPGWQDFKFESSRSLYSQLYKRLNAELVTAETEAPVRLGILVMLEGSAAGTSVREPFERRRRFVRDQIESWWSEAAAASGIVDSRAAEMMTRLTIAFLDGHYLRGEEETEPSLVDPAAVVCLVLAGAFRALVQQDILSPTPTRTVLPLQTEPRVPEDVSERSPDLLICTRSLVAERGYEGATISEICSRSGVQRSAIYRAYESKDALISEAVAVPFLAIASRIKPLTTSTGPQWSAELANSLNDLIDGALTSPETIRSGLLLKLQRREPLMLGSQQIQQGLKANREFVCRWFANSAGLSTIDSLSIQVGWLVSTLAEGIMLGVSIDEINAKTDFAELLSHMLESI